MNSGNNPSGLHNCNIFKEGLTVGKAITEGLIMEGKFGFLNQLGL